MTHIVTVAKRQGSHYRLHLDLESEMYHLEIVGLNEWIECDSHGEAMGLIEIREQCLKNNYN